MKGTGAAPCFGCGERRAGCHGACAAYQAWAETRTRAREARARDRAADEADAARGDKIRRDVRARGLDGTRRRKH